MEKKFKVDFLGEAIDFMESLDEKTRAKIYYNARKSQIVNDPELFKKLNDLIWELRTKFNKNILNKKQREMKNDRLRAKSLDELINIHIGEEGTDKREAFEEELRLDILGQTIKKIREEKHLTQSQLGVLVGVKKAQISKIENNLNDARFETVMKVFRALNAKVNFNVELINQNVSVG